MQACATLEDVRRLTLADWTRPGLIVPRLRGGDVAGVIKELSLVLRREGCVPDLLPFYEAALNREFLAGVVLPHGLAFPHARIPGLDRLWYALGRCAPPIPWAGKTGPAVRLVVLIAVPATDAAGYLRLIRALTRISSNDLLRRDLLAARDRAATLRVLRHVPTPENAVAGTLAI